MTPMLLSAPAVEPVSAHHTCIKRLYRVLDAIAWALAGCLAAALFGGVTIWMSKLLTVR